MVAVNQITEALIQIAGDGWLHFQDPVHVLAALRPDEVTPLLTEVDRRTRASSQHAVGFVCFEAAAAFGFDVRDAEAEGLPLAWFAFFDQGSVRRLSALPRLPESYELGPLTPSLSRPAFDAAFNRIKQHLADGDTYQVNYTFRLAGAFAGHARSLFADLVAAQGGRHAAFISMERQSICSASPELFFAREGVRLSARPMKGTVARGRTAPEDRSQKDRLRLSSKQQAENVMIVDMVRNDLGRIADVGSIEVPELFAVERYPNVWQMTSLVTARSSAPLADVFGALHPSASVTGAPKVRTTAILSALEGRPRGVYTGAIGHVAPDGDVHFNVAIRTAVIDHRTGTVQFGIGSGIVWDSDPADEYEECLLKGSVLGRRPVEFELLETLAWTLPEGFVLLDRHLARLTESAEYFGFACDEGAVREALESASQTFSDTTSEPPRPCRVRLLVSRAGAIRIEHHPVEPTLGVLAVCIDDRPVDSRDPFLFHKTTNRSLYERARSRAPASCDEVILWNASGEVTEAATANVVVEDDGSRVTPPVDCGLLAGTFRAEILAKGEVTEAVVTLDTLRKARQIWLINSVHGWREARLMEPQGQASRAGQAGQAGTGSSSHTRSEGR